MDPDTDSLLDGGLFEVNSLILEAVIRYSALYYVRAPYRRGLESGEDYIQELLANGSFGRIVDVLRMPPCRLSQARVLVGREYVSSRQYSCFCRPKGRDLYSDRRPWHDLPRGQGALHTFFGDYS